MKRVIVDTSALLAFLEDRIGAEKVEELLWSATAKQQPILMSVASWGLLYNQVLRKYGEKLASEKLTQLEHLPLKLLDVDSTIAQDAALLSEKYRLPYLECIAVATAKLLKATLLTANGSLVALNSELRLSILG